MKSYDFFVGFINELKWKLLIKTNFLKSLTGKVTFFKWSTTNELVWFKISPLLRKVIFSIKVIRTFHIQTTIIFASVRIIEYQKFKKFHAWNIESFAGFHWSILFLYLLMPIISSSSYIFTAIITQHINVQIKYRKLSTMKMMYLVPLNVV